MASQLHQLATAMLQDSAARAAQAQTTQEAQRAAAQAQDERLQASTQLVFELRQTLAQERAYREQERTLAQERISVLERGDAQKSAEIEKLRAKVLGDRDTCEMQRFHGEFKTAILWGHAKGMSPPSSPRFPWRNRVDQRLQQLQTLINERLLNGARSAEQEAADTQQLIQLEEEIVRAEPWRHAKFKSYAMESVEMILRPLIARRN